MKAFIDIRNGIAFLSILLILVSCGGQDSPAFDESSPSGNAKPPSGTVNSTNSPSGSGNPETGTAAIVYETQCANCHGVDGRGGSAGGALRPNNTDCEVCNNLDTLRTRIHLTMPLGKPERCDNTCSQRLANYIYSDFTDVNGEGDGSNDTTMPTPTPTPIPAPDPQPLSSIQFRLVQKFIPGSTPISSGSAPLLAELNNGVEINLVNQPLVDIEAIPINVDNVASVTLNLSGAANLSRTERSAGYFLNGDEFAFNRDNGDLPLGHYSLMASANDQDGNVVATRMITFRLVETTGVNSPPVANASNSRNLIGDAPLTVIFDAHASMDNLGIVEYRWIFGDGTSGSGAQTQHTYRDSGSYMAELYVVDEQGLEDSVPITITVNQTATTFDAANLYRTNCSNCHAQDGSGAFGEATTLLGRRYLREDLLAVVSAMPADNPACDGINGCVESMADYLFAHFVEEISVPNPVPTSCEQGGDLLTSKIRRLTQTQFQNAITTTFGNIFPNDIWPNLGDSIPTIGMSNNADGLNIDAINIEEVYRSVSNITDIILLQLQDLHACTASTNSQCIHTLIDEYGPQVWRRPLSTNEISGLENSIQSLRNSGANNTQQLRFLFKSMLLSSNFLFRTELGSISGEIRRLSHYEIASLLAFSLWDSPPDNTLYQLASEARLHDLTTLEEQVIRMTNDNRFRETLVGFYKDFLKLDRVLSVDKIDELDFSDTIRSALLNSSELSLNASLNNLDNSILSPLSGNEFFINNVIASFFNLDSSDFRSEFSVRAIDSDRRNGMLTHPAFLSVHAKEGGSGIVKRGVFVLKQLLCQDLGDPPDELTEAPLPSNIDPEVTSTRTLLHLSHSSQPVCSSCHTKIDPAGYGFENFDTIGRFRLFEKGSVPIDASGSLNVGSTNLQFNNSAEYASTLADAEEMNACISQRLLEYVAGQAVTENSCELNKLHAHINENGNSIENVIRGLMQLESMRLRSE